MSVRPWVTSLGNYAYDLWQGDTPGTQNQLAQDSIQYYKNRPLQLAQKQHIERMYGYGKYATKKRPRTIRQRVGPYTKRLRTLRYGMLKSRLNAGTYGYGNKRRKLAMVSKAITGRARRYIGRKRRPSYRTGRSGRGTRDIMNGVNIYKATSTGQWTWNQNECAYETYTINDISSVEGLLAGTKVLVPKLVAGAYTGELEQLVVDMTKGNLGNNRSHILNFTHSMKIANNHHVNAHIAVYYIDTKVDTSLSPVDAFNNAMTDEGLVAATHITSVNVWPTDFPKLHRKWIWSKPTHHCIRPGQSINLSIHSKKDYWYDPNDFDDEAMDFVKNRTRWIMIKMWGELGHDATEAKTDQVGILPGGLDVQFTRCMRWKANPFQQAFTARTIVNAYDAMILPVTDGPDIDENAFHA